MFELENAIENWRNNLLHKQTMTSMDIDELESHLRDEMDCLILNGLNEQEAFMIASHRMGDSGGLTQEFAKINTREIWRNRVFWMLSGVFAFMVIGTVASFMSDGSKLLFAWIHVAPSISGFISSGIYLFTFMVLALILIGSLGYVSSRMRRKQKKFGKILFQCILVILLLKAGTVFLPALYVSVFGADEYGQMTLSSRYLLLAWQVVWPILLTVLIFLLRPAKRSMIS